MKTIMLVLIRDKYIAMRKRFPKNSAAYKAGSATIDGAQKAIEFIESGK